MIYEMLVTCFNNTRKGKREEGDKLIAEIVILLFVKVFAIVDLQLSSRVMAKPVEKGAGL